MKKFLQVRKEGDSKNIKAKCKNFVSERIRSGVKLMLRISRSLTEQQALKLWEIGRIYRDSLTVLPVIPWVVDKLSTNAEGLYSRNGA